MQIQSKRNAHLFDFNLGHSKNSCYDTMLGCFTRLLSFLCHGTSGNVIRAVVLSAAMLVQIGFHYVYTCEFLQEPDMCVYPIGLSLAFIFYMNINWMLFWFSRKWNQPVFYSNLTAPVYKSEVANPRRDGSVRSRMPLPAGGAIEMEKPGEKNDAKLCTACNRRVPSVARHCSACGHCIVRKDHHCYLTGACVGYATQRYFISFMFWALLASLHGLFWLATCFYITPLWGELNYHLDKLVPNPIVQVYIHHMIVSSTGTLVMIDLGGAIVSAGFLGSQIYVLIRGRTLWSGARVFDTLSFYERLQSIMGPYPLSQLLMPFITKQKIDDEMRVSFQEASRSMKTL